MQQAFSVLRRMRWNDLMIEKVYRHVIPDVLILAQGCRFGPPSLVKAILIVIWATGMS